MKEADLYARRDDGQVTCALCAHRCLIAPGRRGRCGVRQNRDGTLYSLVYGLLVARAVDPIEKKPLYHFLPGSSSFSIATIGCNFRCEFCQNWEISQTRSRDALPGVPTEPDQVVEAALEGGCASISYTYNEPTVFFEFARDTARAARRRGLANVFVTNGYQTPETVRAMAGLIDAANVDLKAFTDEFYRERCGARLEPVLETIRAMHEAGIHVEVTTLIIPGWNDGDDELREIAAFITGISPETAWHVSRFHPDYRVNDRSWTPETTIDRAVRIGRAAGLRYVYAGNVARGESDTSCPACGAVLIRRMGYRISVDALRPEPQTGDAPAQGTCAACGARLPVVTRVPTGADS